MTFSVGRGHFGSGAPLGQGLDRGRDQHGQGPKVTPAERRHLAQ